MAQDQSVQIDLNVTKEEVISGVSDPLPMCACIILNKCMHLIKHTHTRLLIYVSTEGNELMQLKENAKIFHNQLTELFSS